MVDLVMGMEMVMVMGYQDFMTMTLSLLIIDVTLNVPHQHFHDLGVSSLGCPVKRGKLMIVPGIDNN